MTSLVALNNIYLLPHSFIGQELRHSVAEFSAQGLIRLQSVNRAAFLFGNSDSGSASKLFEVVGRINSLGVVGLSCCFASCGQGTAPSF